MATVAGNSVAIHGDSPRGALNGVYWLLEQLGFLRVRPGDAGTHWNLSRNMLRSASWHTGQVARLLPQTGAAGHGYHQ